MPTKKKDPKAKRESSARLRRRERANTPHPRKKADEAKKVSFVLPKKKDKK